MSLVAVQQRGHEEPDQPHPTRISRTDLEHERAIPIDIIFGSRRRNPSKPVNPNAVNVNAATTSTACTGQQCAETVGAAETASAGCCVIVGSALEAPAVIAGFNDVAMVGQAIEQRGGHLGVAEIFQTAALSFMPCGP
jgi:hypothetical protein